MTEAQELIVIPADLNALEAFTKEDAKGLQPLLDIIRSKIDAFVPDITSERGRKEVKSMAYKLARSSTIIDDIGKDLVAEMKKVPGQIDKNRKIVRDRLEVWKDEVRAPLDKYEAAEEIRVANHTAAIEQIRNRAVNAGHANLTLDMVRAMLAVTKEVEVGPACEEFEEEYRLAKRSAITALETAVAAREKYEADQAELDRLRAAAAEREAKDKAEAEKKAAEEAAQRAVEAAKRAEEERAAAEAERQRKAVEAAAQAERDAAAAREKLLQDEIERTQREATEREATIRREAEEAEAKRVKDAADALAREEAAKRQAEAEASARAADHAHRARINSAALAAFVQGGIPEETGRLVISAITHGLIPNVTITY